MPGRLGRLCYMQDYHKLLVWKKAFEFVVLSYRLSRLFPKEEMFGLTSQLRRSAISVATNLVEGVGRQGKNETKQFANIALGSLAETEYLLSFCRKLNFLAENEYNNLIKLKEEVGKLLWGFHRSFL